MVLILVAHSVAFDLPLYPYSVVVSQFAEYIYDISCILHFINTYCKYTTTSVSFTSNGKGQIAYIFGALNLEYDVLGKRLMKPAIFMIQ